MARYKSGQPANRSKTVKKRTYASRTPQARSYKRPSRMAEQGAGMGNVLRGVARVVGAGGKARAAAGKPKPNPGSRTAKKQPTAKKTTAKKTSGRKPAQKDVLTRGEQAQLRADAARKRALARGDRAAAAKHAEKSRALGAKDTAKAKASKARRIKAQKRPERIAVGTAAGVAVGGAAVGSAIAKQSQRAKPKRFRK